MLEQPTESKPVEPFLLYVGETPSIPVNRRERVELIDIHQGGYPEWATVQAIPTTTPGLYLTMVPARAWPAGTPMASDQPATYCKGRWNVTHGPSGRKVNISSMPKVGARMMAQRLARVEIECQPVDWLAQTPIGHEHAVTARLGLDRLEDECRAAAEDDAKRVKAYRAEFQAKAMDKIAQ